jgi:poly(3-hydroxybutyrate) depolymerase
MKRFTVVLSAVLLVLICMTPAFARKKKDKGDKGARGTFTFQGHQRTYVYQVPDNISAKTPVPAIVLIHAQGAWASSIFKYWNSYASQLGIVIIAPEALSNTNWVSTTDGPDFLHAVVAEVNKVHAIDPRRVYLFGNETGGAYAMAVGLYDSTFWAATAVHQGILSPSNYFLFEHAEYKEPFALFMGTRDRSLSVNLALNERDAFKAHGFPFLLKVDSFATGAYENNYDQVNEGAWKFFSKYELPESVVAGRIGAAGK